MASPPSLSSLALLGDARPVSEATIAAVEAQTQIPWPVSLRQLLLRWGPGLLAGQLELFDPSDPDPQAPWLRYQQLLATNGRRARARGLWANLDEAELPRLVIVGRDHRGNPIALRPDQSVVVLEATGRCVLVSSFIDYCNLYVLWANVAPSPSLSPSHPVSQGFPLAYRAGPERQRAAFLAAVDRGDEAAADHALEQQLAGELRLSALLYTLHALSIAPMGEASLRRQYGEQLIKMIKRISSSLVDEATWSALRAALRTGPAPAESAAALLANDVIPAPSGPFFEPIEVASGLPAALTDAAERGFIPPPHLRTIDADAWLHTTAQRWAEEDPTIDVGDLVGACRALRPQELHGYLVLLEQAPPWAFRHPGYASEPAIVHLVREAALASPVMQLSLRARHAEVALWLLTTTRFTTHAPRLRSLVRSLVLHWSRALDGSGSVLANVCRKVWRAVDDELVTALLPLLETPIAELREHRFHEIDRYFTASALLVDRDDDPRVFDAYLTRFLDLYPYSETVLCQHEDARTIPMLLGLLDMQQVSPDGHLSEAFDMITSTLAHLGHPAGVAGQKRWRAYRKRLAKTDL